MIEIDQIRNGYTVTHVDRGPAEEWVTWENCEAWEERRRKICGHREVLDKCLHCSDTSKVLEYVGISGVCRVFPRQR